ncbi:hypothetical protein JCM10213_006329 [Rhodosporidiobolus nylandii]
MRSFLLSAGALALAALAPSQSAASPLVSRASSAPTATIANGTVTGLSLPSFSAEAFLGVPFAQPPTGERRFRRPQSLEKQFDGGVFEATEYSPFCPGVGGDNVGYKQDEDCLTVNIHRPAGTTADDKLPVGLWIYGGGFQMGGNADQRYNSSYMVQRSVEMGKPIVVVQVNYRTAALGFLNSEEMKDAGLQNNGLYDQRLAFHWVQENIPAFGGDPTKVTIWGESAGAMSVAYHLLGYGLTETSLFSGAILESGNAHTAALQKPAYYQNAFDAVVEGTGCSDAKDSLACLRTVPLEKLNSTAAPYTWDPVVDGELISALPSDTLAADSFIKVPLLIGANTDEGSAFGAKGINTTADLEAALYQSFPALTNASVAQLLDLYPNDPLVGCPFNTGDLILPSGLQDKRSNAIFGDLRFQAGRRELAEKTAKSAPVYSYRFDQPSENSTVSTGVTHFVEVAYVFRYPYKTANTLGTRPGDAELALLVQSQWISFIHDANPNGHGIEGVPEWPNYQDSASNFVHRRHGSVTEDDNYRAEGFKLINSLGYQVYA